MSDPLPFWKRKRLDQLSADEWERLCDGCAKCCLVRLEFEDTGEIEATSVACRLLDPDTCRCTSYPDRQEVVPDCLALTPVTIEALTWLPSTCAYRRVSRGEALPRWHPLVAGDAEAVHLAGASVRGRTISEDHVSEDDLEDYIMDD